MSMGHQSDGMKVGGIYHWHPITGWFLYQNTIVEYPIQQVVRRHFSLKQLRLSLTMEVLMTRKKKVDRDMGT